MSRALITDARPWGGAAADIRLVDGVIAEVLPPGTAPQAGETLIEGRGRLLLPSFADVHVHLDSTRLGLPFREHSRRCKARW